jgi:hypothetical protein
MHLSHALAPLLLLLLLLFAVPSQLRVTLLGVVALGKPLAFAHSKSLQRAQHTGGRGC